MSVTLNRVETGAPSESEIASIVQARHGDPFAVLGPHELPNGCAIRAFLPAAQAVAAVSEVGETLAELDRIDPAGFWSGMMPQRRRYRLRLRDGRREREIDDPYGFGASLGELDIYLLAEGRHRELGRTLGAQVMSMDGVHGVRFAVWAPNARRVSVVGSFNSWDGRCHPMRLRHGAGVWELFIPGLARGALYKYELLGPHGGLLPLKADPVAGAAELPPNTASIVTDDQPRWRDVRWMEGRARGQSANAPMSIYEVHAQSWLHPTEAEGDIWTQLTHRLIPYASRMGFTHVELLPIMEHPFAGSWGYQPLGQFAPSARLGSPEAFATFVDQCHDAGIGVILDWVPAHFPSDAHGLVRFDGTALYEHADPREGFHKDWNTLIYNLGRREVRGFLIGSALHWLERFHVDGLRVDAVASMLYRDYSRAEGEWVPNQYGGRENLEAVGFLQELSRVVQERCPGALLIAEESTAWPGVTRPADEGGLGFHYKWNMGWMHDTLHYIEENSIHRRWHHDQMTFGLIYAFSERFVLPLSHDEVVYGKGSLFGKMPGDHWQKFANLRAYLGFMWTHPGKKLLFMGGEFAQQREWNHDSQLDWHLLDDPRHAGVQRMVADLNRLYRDHPALHRRDSEPEGFRWVIADDREASVFAYLRFGQESDVPMLVVCNFTPVPRAGYRVGAPEAGGWREVFNSDSSLYGGTNMGNGGWVPMDGEPAHGLPGSVVLTVPPLATIVLQAA